MKKVIIILTLILNLNFVYANEVGNANKNTVLYNLNDNKIIYEENGDDKVAIASLTKIMTTLIAIENIKNIDEEVTITNEAFKNTTGYTKAGFKVGDKVTYKDLLYGIMLPSGADAVNATIINVTNDKSKYVDLMNNKAKELNLNNTHFDNAVGMDTEDENGNIVKDFSSYKDSGNYSTANDMATLLKYALENQTFKEIFEAREYIVPSTKLKLNSTLKTYSKNTDLNIENIKGAKSGFTDGAGYCLASTAEINDVNYLLIVLGSNTTYKSNAIKDTVTIYDYYSKNYSYQKISTKGDTLHKIKIKLGKKEYYDVKVKDDITLYLKNDIDKTKIKYEYEGINELNYKIKKNTKLGTITIKYEDEELYKQDIYLDEDIKYYHPLIYSTILIGVISLLTIKIKLKRKKRKRKK